MVIDQSNSLQKSYNFEVLQDICSSRVETANFFLGIYETLGDGYDVERQFYQEQISQYKLYDVWLFGKFNDYRLCKLQPFQDSPQT